MKWWTAALLCGAIIVVIVVLADTGNLGPLAVIYVIPGGDKVGHFEVYGLLSLFVNSAALRHWRKQVARNVVLCASLFLAVPIGLEELSQNWFPSRTASWTDLAAGYLGVALFAGIALMMARRSTHRRK